MLPGAESLKKLAWFTTTEGASAQCQADNLRLAHQVVFDWFDEFIARPKDPGMVDPASKFQT